MTDDTQLLRQFTEGSEPAFAELVSRYVNLVYSTALRQLGDAQLAEDVVQTVFTALARKARLLPGNVVLGGWLYRHTTFVAAQSRRTDQRRRARETQALAMNNPGDDTEPQWEQLAPVLDEAMNRLGRVDRDAIVLRFFQGRGVRDVGAALGINEDAARKRISRALERLRTQLSRRGITSTASGLAAALAVSATISAPAGLAASVASSALVATVSAAAITFNLFNLVTMTKLQAGIIGVLVIAGVATPLVVQRQTQARLRTENRSLHEQVEQLTPFIAETERLSNLIAQAAHSQPRSDPSEEMLRLRAEVTRLRANAEQSARSRLVSTNDPMESAASDLLAKVGELKHQLEQSPELKIPEMQLLSPTDWFEVALQPSYSNAMSVRSKLGTLRGKAKTRFAVMVSDALRDFAEANGSRLPSDLSELQSYLELPADEAMLKRYQLLQHGDLSQASKDSMLIGEKAAVDEIMDSLYSIGLNQYKVRHITGSGRRGGPDGEAIVRILPKKSRPK